MCHPPHLRPDEQAPSSRRPRPALSLLFLVGVLAAGCGNGSDAAPASGQADRAERPQPSIVEVAQVAGQFSTLLRAAEAAGLAGTLANDGPFTVFAPTDGAFADLPEGVLDGLLDDPEALAQILLYHVVPGSYTVAELRDQTELETAQGGRLRIASTADGLTVNGTYLLTADIRASNGMVHVITSVLTP